MRLDHRGLRVAFGVLVLIVLLGPFLGSGMMGPGMMWGYGVPVGGHGWAWGLGLGRLALLAFWGALIVGAILLVRWAVGQWPSGADHGHDALAILRRRYAAGEIDQATYERMRWELSGTTEGAPATSRRAGGRTNGQDESQRLRDTPDWHVGRGDGTSQCIPGGGDLPNLRGAGTTCDAVAPGGRAMPPAADGPTSARPLPGGEGSAHDVPQVQGPPSPFIGTFGPTRPAPLSRTLVVYADGCPEGSPQRASAIKERAARP